MRQLDSCDFCGEHPEGVFEVVPGSAAGGSRRLALCTSCRGTLQSVVDPLLDSNETGNRTRTSNGDAGADDSPDDESDPRGANATPDSVPEVEPDRETESTPEQASVDEASGDGGTGETARGSEHDPDSGGVTIQSGGSDANGGKRKPDGYAQVIRLLQNREGAMPRSDLRALATNAYDLRERAFEDAVDAAVENGDVEETSGGLRTTSQ